MSAATMVLLDSAIDPAPTSTTRDDQLADRFFDIVLADHDLLADAFEEVVADLTGGAPPVVTTPVAPRPAGRRPLPRSGGSPWGFSPVLVAVRTVPAGQRWARSPPAHGEAARRRNRHLQAS